MRKRGTHTSPTPITCGWMYEGKDAYLESTSTSVKRVERREKCTMEQALPGPFKSGTW